MYCVVLNSQYEVQWRRVNFHDFHHWREDGQAPETVFRLRVGGALSTYGVSVPLEVWQSADERLVLAVTCDGVSEEREGASLWVGDGAVSDG